MSSMMASALTVCVCILLPAVAGVLSHSRLCVLSGSLQGAPSSLQENDTVRCAHGSRCYALWEKMADGEFHLLNQGCWTRVGDQPECESVLCMLHTRTSLANTNYRWCCCDRDLCNANYSEGGPAPAPAPAPQPMRAVDRDGCTEHQVTAEEAGLVALVTVAIAAILIMSLFLGYRLLKRRKTLSAEDQMEASDGEQVQGLSNLKLLQMIGQGRYGSVFRGVLNERCVAIKRFSSGNRENFCKERSIYSLLLPHHNVARFLWADQGTGSDGQSEFFIVMEFYPNGCLSSYLSVHTVDWWTMCRMTHGVTLGLSFLHTALHQGGEVKPGVAHRDLSSRNVLVRGDLSCVLADFNLSSSLKDKPCYHGDQDTLSIAEVGTVRYLSPEVLGGTVNLRDWDTALKQVDIYALGLMFWETFRRCSDLFTGESPEYELAFQAELGDHPTLEQMRASVVREKLRPKIPEKWKEHTQLCLLIELIVDCWDQDAEARLTAQCAEERLGELTLMSVHNSRWPSQLGVVKNLHKDAACVVMTTTSDADIQDGNRKCVNQERQQISSEAAAPPVDSSQNLLQPQVEMGVAKMDMVSNVLMAELHLVTTVTNLRRTEVQCFSVACEAEDGGRINPAGPQEEEEEEEEEGGLDAVSRARNLLFFSPDEHEPLLRRQEPPQNLHHHQSRTNYNNNNNNHSESFIRPTAAGYEPEAEDPEPADGPNSSGPILVLPPCSQSPERVPSSAEPLQRAGTNPGRPERPRSLDLSSPSLALGIPLSASAEKIKRRVKTPYTLKKWRPASWIVSTDAGLDRDFQLSLGTNNQTSVSSGPHKVTSSRMNQSKSSMAVFLVGGGATETTTSDPDGITSF